MVSLVNRDLNQLTQADSVEWSVEVSRDTLPLTEQNEIHLLDRAPGLRDAHGWDYMVYLTDLPRSLDNNSLVCEVDVTGNATLLSLPALGAVHVKSRARRVLTELVIAMAEESPGKYTTGYPRGFSRRNWQKVQREGDEENYEIILRALSAVLVFWRAWFEVIGPCDCCRPCPVRSRPPWHRWLRHFLRVHLEYVGCAHHPSDGCNQCVRGGRVRHLAHRSQRAMGLFRVGGWPNTQRLGQRGNSPHRGNRRCSMYLVLWAILFAVTLAVVNAEYLAGDIGHPVNLLDYLDIAWLASALGMMGGAMGSNFDKESDIREATYTRREYTRRKMAEREENQD
ncbi:hypothetical protein [Kocuria atrinae]|uniref:hypothetical protein n=1 Tax=Kocuria atrinae TaxID=592377 RepID=UPI001CB9825D|nr:hypothetical protein [Kocuria atrinae]